MTAEPEQWDHECDVLVVGSGLAGMTAALTAQHNGLDVLIAEKMEKYGGSSALSGGGVWIPNNPVNVRSGLSDSYEKARTYMKAIVGDRVAPERIDAFLTAGPEAIAFLEKHTRHVRFRRVPGYSDYHPEEPGGEPAGRTMEPLPFDTRKLGSDEETLNKNPMMTGPAGMWLTQSDYRKLTQVLTTWAGRRTAIKVGIRTFFTRATGRHMVSLGAAGVARFRMSLKEAGVPLWLNTALVDLVEEDGTVVGAVLEREDRTLRVRTRRGVVLAAGGFEKSEEMRRRYQAEPINSTWTSGSPGNTGDAIRIGEKIGAALDLMDDAWWGPSVDTGGPAIFILAERSLPGAIVVNAAGQRYVNEASPYVNFVHRMYELNGREGVSHIPSFLIVDHDYRNKYPFSAIPPRRPFPKVWTKFGIVTVSESLAELAEKIGVPADNLAATFERYNQLVATGRDSDFGKGDSAYDRYYGDPAVKPNPCLAPIGRPPFYSFRLVPGDLGTKGGLLTDEHARVLRADGKPITGLYAAGNCSAAVMGNEYAGAGATIGPAITFGYVAALHIAASVPATA